MKSELKQLKRAHQMQTQWILRERSCCFYCFFYFSLQRKNKRAQKHRKRADQIRSQRETLLELHSHDYRFPACNGLVFQFSQWEQMCVCFSLKPESDFVTTSGAVSECFDEHILDCLYLMFCSEVTIHISSDHRGCHSERVPVKGGDHKTTRLS